MDTNNLLQDIESIYTMVPKQFQRHSSELDVKLASLRDEFRILNDNIANQNETINKLNKKIEKLINEKATLQEQCDKLNKKLNSELLK